MRGDTTYARGFTLLLYGMGIVLFVVMTFDSVDPFGTRRGVLKFIAPPSGELHVFWASLAALLFVAALLRSWESRVAWGVTWAACVVLFFWFPLGTFTSWSWFRSLRRSERPLTG